MEVQRPLAVQAVVSLKGEQEPFLAGLRQAVNWLRRAGSAVPKIDVRATPALLTPSLERPVDITFVSFIGEITAGPADFASFAASWRRRIVDFTAASEAPLFLCTVFRRLSDSGASHRGAGMAQLERIRRINLFIVELSQATGVYVIDIDGLCAHLGGSRLRTDVLLGGMLGAAAAGEAIASALLTEGLEGYVPAEGLARATALHGGRQGSIQRLNRAVASEDARDAG